MRRAEKAGRESAQRAIEFYQGNADAIRACADLKAPPHHAATAVHGVSTFATRIGAHNLTGRALEAAYAAYDRGYRARLKEELERLQKTSNS